MSLDERGHASDRGHDRPSFSRRTPWDPETHYRIEESGTPVSEDGYKHNEPKWLVCAACGARVLLTEDPSPGIDEPGHEPACPQRFVKSDWWTEQFQNR